MRKKPVIKLFLLGMLLPIAACVTAVLFVYAVQEPQSQAAETIRPLESIPLAQEDPVPSNTVTVPIDSGAFEITNWQLVLVNAESRMPDSFTPVIVESFNVEMEERIVEPYTKLYRQAQADGISLWISSAYRSPERQEELFEREVEQNLQQGMTEAEAVQKAETAVQRPYYSEHNTGLAIDFNGVTEGFKDDEAYQWLMEHAEEYGFILRYPEGKEDITGIMYEPWHFRYVGPENAIRMNELGLCLEEYIQYLKLHPQEAAQLAA